ncbi:MAG: hypothetical protein OHK0038_22370 [Flammeovirgaceae bacterium]
MKKIFHISFFTALLLVFNACSIDDSVDPNRPSIEGILKNATIPQLNNLVVGTVGQMRASLDAYYDAVSVIGREIYRFSSSDPRYTADLPGGTLDNNAFYLTNPYAGRYGTVKNCNILLASLENTTSPTPQQKEGYRGFAKTIKAHELLMVLNQLNENGIRIDVEDPDNLGDFVSKDAALTAIATLLDEAAAHLDNAGTSFAFSLSTGFAGFNTPSTFKKFNRGLAARVAVYRGKYADALTILDASFLDLNGDLNVGVYHVFGLGSGDTRNLVFLPLNSNSDVRAAHPKFLEDAESGDTRLSKVVKRAATATQSGFSSDYDAWVYQSNTSPIPIVRNEELILIYAEASIQTDKFEQGINALNIIRAKAGLAPYAGNTDKTSLINEMLNQRRYSLFFEGHRWVDMRRYNKLGELPIDRAGDKVHVSFPIPLNEERF